MCGMETTNQSIDLLNAAEAYAETFIREQISDDYVFHNLQHTCAVVQAALQLADHYELKDEEHQAVVIAAWFHDLGYDQGYDTHEQRSAEYAAAFLVDQGASKEMIENVRRAILATRIPQEPTSLIEKIVCDADLSHLGNAFYWDRCGRIRQEMALTRNLILSDQEWVDLEIDFMLRHHYFTEAAQEQYGEEKEKHVRQLLKQKRRLHPDQSPQDLVELKEDQSTKQKKKKKKKKKGLANDPHAEIKQLNLGRGVETMYRTTYRTHVNLSSIADNKANIMLSINAIIISIVVSSMVPRLNDEPYLAAPTFILISVCLVSLVFAILSTRPKVTEGRFTREDIEQKRSNLLFFGNFYKMDLDDFHWGMMEMIKDSDFLYSSMTRDLYYLGVVLAKKYQFLRICYSIFMFGLILAVFAYVIAFYIGNQPS